MAKNTISMKRFKANLTKISRLAKSGYKSITSVAKQIIATVTNIASKISVLSENAYWQGGNESLPADGFGSYYDRASKEEEAYLNRSLSNLTNYKDEIIFDIFTISDALSHNAEQMGYVISQEIKKAFGESAEGFFESGKSVGQSFGDGMKVSIEDSIREITSVVNAAMQNINLKMSVASSAANSAGQITYSNPSYNFYSSSQTVSQQLSEARRAETINSLRGLN